MARFMAVDQYGNTHHGLSFPRRDLLALVGRRHADKMYVDRRDGTAAHIGYVIGGLWLTVYEVRRLDAVKAVPRG